MGLFIGSLVIVVFFLIYLYLLCRRISTDISRAVQHMIIVGAGITIVVIFQMLCDDETVSRALFGLYFCATDWLMYIICRFSLIYTDNGRYMKYFHYAFPFLVFDVFFMGLNVQYQYAFSVVKINTFIGEFYKFVPGDFFQVHGVVIYGLVSFSLITLFVKMVKTPRIYKKKYAFIFILILAIVVLNAIFMFTGDTVDFTVYAYAVGAMMFYYFPLGYIPKELMNQTISVVSHESKEGIIVFDETACIYANTSARDFLRVDRDSDVLLGLNQNELIRKYINPEYSTDEGDSEFNHVYTEGDKTYYYKSTFRKLYDSNGGRIGSSLVIYDKTDEDRALREQTFLATHDNLTGLYNREHFYSMVRNRLSKDEETKYVMVCSDITKFSLISDMFGEQIADNVIIKVAEGFREFMPPEAVYGRLYSDRFAALLPKQLLEEKTLIKMAEAINKGDRGYSYTVKICYGTYDVIDRELPVSVMCDRALSAIASIKEDYRKYVAHYNEKSLESLKREQELISELDEALNNQDMTVFLQPIVKADGTVMGAEALARWQHPTRGLISPGVFIPVFEKRNLIVKVDVYIWEKACQILHNWITQGKDWFISVNVSTKDIYFLDIFDILTKLATKYHVPADRLRIEITESAVAQDVATVKALIERLRRIGFVVEIDDFGSGYSSLNMLKDFIADVLKIDMKFLSKADEDRRSKEILRSVISLAKNLGMEVITEGVETVEQAEFLAEERCDLFQGFYFSKPVPVDEFIQRVDEIKKAM